MQNGLESQFRIQAGVALYCGGSRVNKMVAHWPICIGRIHACGNGTIVITGNQNTCHLLCVCNECVREAQARFSVKMFL